MIIVRISRDYLFSLHVVRVNTVPPLMPLINNSKIGNRVWKVLPSRGGNTIYMDEETTTGQLQSQQLLETTSGSSIAYKYPTANFWWLIAFSSHRRNPTCGARCPTLRRWWPRGVGAGKKNLKTTWVSCMRSWSCSDRRWDTATGTHRTETNVWSDRWYRDTIMNGCRRRARGSFSWRCWLERRAGGDGDVSISAGHGRVGFLLLGGPSPSSPSRPGVFIIWRPRPSCSKDGDHILYMMVPWRSSMQHLQFPQIWDLFLCQYFIATVFDNFNDPKSIRHWGLV